MVKVCIKITSKGTEVCKKWLELPLPFNKYLEDVLIDIGDEMDLDFYDDEVTIVDCDTDLEFLTINEETDFDELNDFLIWYEDLDITEQAIIEVLFENKYANIQDAEDSLDNCIIYYNCYDMRDVAKQIVENDKIFDEVPDYLRDTFETYFDYERYGRDLEINGTYLHVLNNLIVEVTW